MVNSDLFVLDRSQDRRKLKSNDVHHTFQIFEFKKTNIIKSRETIDAKAKKLVCK